MFFEFLYAILGKLLFFTSAVGGKGSFPKPLPPEEEARYLKLAREGDQSAKDMLVRHNMRLVAHIVKKYNGAAETDDLISVGSIGLIKAINTYQEGRGTQLATYTARCIENEILMLLRSNKKHKNNVYLFDPVGVDKEGNEIARFNSINDAVRNTGVSTTTIVNHCNGVYLNKYSDANYMKRVKFLWRWNNKTEEDLNLLKDRLASTLVNNFHK